MEDCGEGGVRFRGAKKGTKAEMQFAERKIQTGCKEKKKITMMVVRTWNGGPKGVPIHRHIENLIVQV